MSYTVQKHLTKVNKGAKGKNNPQWIVVHFVGATGQAWDNANYFYSTYRGASAHYFLDPKNIVQVVEDDTPAWHVGDGSRSKQGAHNGYVKSNGATNNNAIGLELCQDTSTGKNVWHWDFHADTVKRAEWLIKKLQKQYNIPDSRVIRHYDASGKNCPGNWSHNNWAKWHDFKARLAGIKDVKPTGTVSKDEGKPAVNGKTHTVQSGDTLGAIAKKYGVSLDNLTAWNNIDNPNLIFPETVLFVEAPKKSEPKTDIEKLAVDTIAGKYGNGEDRKKALGKNFDAVQKRVDELMRQVATKPAQSKPQPKPVAKPATSTGKVTLSTSAKKYVTGENIPASIKGKQYTVQETRNNGSELLLKEIVSWVYAKDTTGGAVKASAPKASADLTGKKVTLNKGASKYVTGEAIPASIKGKQYTVQQTKSNNSHVLLKEIMSWVYTKDVTVGGSTPAPAPKAKPVAKPVAKAKKYNLPTGTFRLKSPLMFGNNVKVIQQALSSIHFYPDKFGKNQGIDGYYGSKTANAVMRFQSMYGLKADGIYGDTTRRKLDSMVN